MTKDNWFLMVGKEIEKKRKKKEQKTITDLTKEKRYSLQSWKENSEGSFTMIFTIICVFIAVLVTRLYYNNISSIDMESREMIKIMFYVFTIGIASCIIIMEIIGAFVKRRLKYELNILNKGRKK